MKTILSKTALLALLTCSIQSVYVLNPLAASAEVIPANLTVQANPYDPFPDYNDGFYPLIIDTMRMVDSARRAMQSKDPEVKALGEKMYEAGMRDLQGLMMMWMKKNPIRSTSPRS